MHGKLQEDGELREDEDLLQSVRPRQRGRAESHQRRKQANVRFHFVLMLILHFYVLLKYPGLVSGLGAPKDLILQPPTI